ncbi:GNAT family N-acetyltransferase [Anaerobium acetethylicum]|nr:GNAT family N-acetyltransferase [Anaerobium acetethylicum]
MLKERSRDLLEKWGIVCCQRKTMREGADFLMNMPDIYFEEYWGLLNAEHDGGVYDSYTYEDENGQVVYRFIKRPTMILPDTYDITTPYGFSGPVVTWCKPGKRKDLVRNFDFNFQNYCRAHGIVAEYVRFSPWLKNHEDYSDIYEMKYNKYTVGVDLTKDFFNEEFSSKIRNRIRKAEKSGVRVEFDFHGETADELLGLYNLMAEKNHIGEQYRFTSRFMSDMVKACRNHQFIINVLHNEKVISSAMFIHGGEYIHYHLAGNDPECYEYQGSSLIIAKACEWGKSNGKIAMHLGGGPQGPDGSLLHFKKQFTKEGIFEFYVGKKIRLNDLYQQLVEIKGEHSDYFPAYR